MAALRPLEWAGDHLRLLDQTLLPHEERWSEIRDWRGVVAAIRSMQVRGAPAIGIAAAYGMVLARRTGEDWDEARAALAASRPTAVNLFWALERMDEGRQRSFEELVALAGALEEEERARSTAMAEHGAALIPPRCSVLTLCNTGSLATIGPGTALGVIRAAWKRGLLETVYACETRPRGQGLLLTAWELRRSGIPHFVIADGAAGALMRAGRVGAVLVGADRIAANGDTANKIGTYGLAVLAARHGLPFYVVVPTSSIDPTLPDGEAIPIEERSSEEITTYGGRPVAPAETPCWNPAFDVTPAELVTAIVTEEGVHRAPYRF